MMDWLNDVCAAAEKKLSENHIYANVWPYRSDMPVMDVEISWGDWKHEHARAKWLIGEMDGIHYISSEVTEENGSDCILRCITSLLIFLVDAEVCCA